MHSGHLVGDTLYGVTTPASRCARDCGVAENVYVACAAASASAARATFSFELSLGVLAPGVLERLSCDKFYRVSPLLYLICTATIQRTFENACRFLARLCRFDG